MKKKKNKRDLWWKIGIGVLGLVILFFCLWKGSYSAIERYLKDGLNVFTYPIWNRKKEDQTESYLIQKNVNRALLSEIEELKELLDLSQTMTDYRVIHTTLVHRQIDYWLQTIVVDKGTKEGVSKDDIAITSSGMIGRVKDVTHWSSEIELLSANDPSFQVSVQMEVGEETFYGILSGYDQKNQVFEVRGISSSASIPLGVEVTTSGLTGNYPKGIFIGTVEASDATSSYEKLLKVKPKQDFNQLRYISILSRREV